MGPFGAAILFLVIFFMVRGIIKAFDPKPTMYGIPEAEMQRADGMTGQQFEAYCMKLLRDSGMFPGARFSLTKTTGDFGVDILITMPDKSRCVVQCKRYARNVGVKPVQEIYAGMRYYGAARAMVMTNAEFTESAEKLAWSTGVALYGRGRIKGIIEQIRKREVERLKKERRESKHDSRPE